MSAPREVRELPLSLERFTVGLRKTPAGSARQGSCHNANTPNEGTWLTVAAGLLTMSPVILSARETPNGSHDENHLSERSRRRGSRPRPDPAANLPQARHPARPRLWR